MGARSRPRVSEDVAREAVQRFFARHAEAVADRSMRDMRSALFAQWAAAADVVRRLTPADWHRVRIVRPGGALRPGGTLAPGADACDALDERALGLDEFGAELLWIERHIDRLAGECEEGWHAVLMVRVATGMYVRSALHAFPMESHYEGQWSDIDWTAVHRDMGEPPDNKYPRGMMDRRGGLPRYRLRDALICSAVDGLVAVGFNVGRNPQYRNARENPSACSLVAEAVNRSESAVGETYAKGVPLPDDCPRFEARWECAEVEGERAAQRGEPRDPARGCIADSFPGDPGRLVGAAIDEAQAWLRGHDRVTGYCRALAEGYGDRYDTRVPRRRDPLTSD